MTQLPDDAYFTGDDAGRRVTVRTGCINGTGTVLLGPYCYPITWMRKEKKKPTKVTKTAGPYWQVVLDDGREFAFGSAEVSLAP